MELLEKALNDGWKIVRMDTIPPLEVPCAALSATNVYILEKGKRGREMNGVLDLLPHDMGLRVELDTNETYYLKSGWAERWDGIYGIACGYVDCSEVITWFEGPGRIAIMKSHVKLAVPFDEHETETTKQNEDTNMKDTNR
jgi:hypothetical protein